MAHPATSVSIWSSIRPRLSLNCTLIHFIWSCWQSFFRVVAEKLRRRRWIGILQIASGIICAKAGSHVLSDREQQWKEDSIDWLTSARLVSCTGCTLWRRGSGLLGERFLSEYRKLMVQWCNEHTRLVKKLDAILMEGERILTMS